jgi:hypothetical protein
MTLCVFYMRQVFYLNHSCDYICITIRQCDDCQIQINVYCLTYANILVCVKVISCTFLSELAQKVQNVFLKSKGSFVGLRC